MQFSDIIKMVQDIWSFSWPPLVICGLAYFMARFFHPAGTTSSLQKILSGMKKYGDKLESTRTILEPYGLTKLVPTISIIMLVSGMFLLNGPITSLVSNIPPYVSYNLALLATKAMSEAQQLALIRKYPMAQSVVEAYYLALRSAELESKIKPDYEGLSLWNQAQDLLKFALVFATIMLIVSLKAKLPLGKQITKYLLVLVVLMFLWTISLAGLLFQQERVINEESDMVVIPLIKDASPLLTLPITEKEMDELNQVSHEMSQNWWQVYVIDEYRWEWVKKTFYPNSEPKWH
ncbi:hypothetical protein V7H95_14595 [Serratia marcescens]|uniref:hypothetical protein n=1 Tax=Serratia marcescens TaxID=615 RepID=UPI002FF034E5